jgi:hypothetical protein
MTIKVFVKRARRRLRLLPLALSMFAALGASAAAQDATPAQEKEANIRRLLELTRAGDLGVQVVEQGLAQIRVSLADAPPALRDRVLREFETQMRAEFTSEKMVSSTVPIYAKHLTNDEVKALIQFYETPVGQKLISVQPQITAEAYEDGARRGREVGDRVLKKLQDEGVFSPPDDQIAPPASKPKPRPATTPRPRRRT